MDEMQDKLVAVLISPETADQTRDQEERRGRFWRAAERIAARNCDKDPEAELPFITEVVEQVRQERYEQEQAQTKSGR